MLKNLFLGVILIGLIVFTCSKVFNYSWDITQNHANSLSSASKQLLDNIDKPVQITIYSPSIEILNIYRLVLDIYKKYSPYINYSLEQSVISPPVANRLKVYTDNVIVAKYNNNEFAIDIQNDKIAEQQVSNLIQQTTSNINNWVAFITGHDELDPTLEDESGLSSFASIFTRNGMHIASLNLATQFIPENTSLMIIANPKYEFLEPEINILREYIHNGGKVIWFSEPGTANHNFLIDEFGVQPSSGVIIDPFSLQLGSPHPALKVLNNNTKHAITENLHSNIIMPWSSHLEVLYEAHNWQSSPIITTREDSWTYSGPATKDLEHLGKLKEHLGPLTIGVALTREATNNQLQKALIFGDSSFIINKYFKLLANEHLINNIIAWVIPNQTTFVYNAPLLKDASYQPSKFDQSLFQYGFTLLIPLLLICIGHLSTKPKRRSFK